MKLWSGPHTIHARGAHSYIVKLDAAMRWYHVFEDGSRCRLKYKDAARVAYEEGMEVYRGLPGGGSFDKAVEAFEAQAAGMKRCSVCRELLPVDEYPQHGSSLLGRNSRCSSCLVEYRKRFKEQRYEHMLERQLAYRTANRESIRMRQAAYRDRNSDAILEQARVRARHYPEMRVAYRKVRNAIEKGLLVRPDSCTRCGEGGAIQASHDDYSRPLDVEWLCQSCHSKKDHANPLTRLGPEYSLTAIKANSGARGGES